ncbi:MAG: hypothetical protein DRJ29_07670 [Bacteroidetes bacterium]|nr:MAG: hypothetical protein DRJ29_07670 [Bacteroidota bacterium]
MTPKDDYASANLKKAEVPVVTLRTYVCIEPAKRHCFVNDVKESGQECCAGIFQKPEYAGASASDKSLKRTKKEKSGTQLGNRNNFSKTTKG